MKKHLDARVSRILNPDGGGICAEHLFHGAMVSAYFRARALRESESAATSGDDGSLRLAGISATGEAGADPGRGGD